MIRAAIDRTQIAEYAANAAATVPLVAAGYGIDFTSTADAQSFPRADIAFLPPAEARLTLATDLLRPNTVPAGAAQHVINRLLLAPGLTNFLLLPAV